MEKSNRRGIAAKERKERKRNYYFRPGTPEGIRVCEIGTAPGDCTNQGLMPVGTSVAPIGFLEKDLGLAVNNSDDAAGSKNLSPGLQRWVKAFYQSRSVGAAERALLPFWFWARRHLACGNVTGNLSPYRARNQLLCIPRAEALGIHL
jgi:hypothetical protein